MVIKLAATVVVATTLVGCNNPVAPSSHICYTQPRLYTNPTTGQSQFEIDHYEQSAPCPITPIP